MAEEIPLFPKRPPPRVLFCAAMLPLGGFWLSDDGFTTMKHLEPVALMLWLGGWMAGVIGLVIVLLYVLVICF